MTERRLDNDRRELPERRKVNAPVENDRRSGITRRTTGERSQAGIEGCFGTAVANKQKKSKRQKKGQPPGNYRKAGLPEKGEAEKTGGLCAEGISKGAPPLITQISNRDYTD